MSFFCFLWVPLFYFFWRGITVNNTSGWAWALFGGSVVAILQFLIGPAITPAEFGIARWVSGFVDIVALPALVPLLVYLLLFSLGVVSGEPDYAGFALLWIIPSSILRSLTWSYIQRDPILLVLVPVLWTAIAIGIPFFISMLQNSRLTGIILASLAIVAIPLTAATSYWAFFSHRNIMGSLFFVTAIAPMVVSAVLSFRAADQR